MAIQVISSITHTKKHFDALYKRIEKATATALRDMEREIVKEVLDNSNWSDQAVYKGGPQEGQKYDLNFTGQLLRTISDMELNFVVKNGSQFAVGIGNIAALDSLRSLRQGRNAGVKYWRLAVFGRSRIPNWEFVSNGSVWKINSLKTKGVSKPSFKGISPSEPTLMFDNGLFKARRRFPSIITGYLKQAIHTRPGVVSS